MRDIEYYRSQPVEDRRVAFQHHVNQAIQQINTRRWDYDLPIGRSWSYINGKTMRPWNRYELNSYASDILEELCRMADAGDMISAGIKEHEELMTFDISARMADGSEPPLPDGAVGSDVVVTVSVLGTPLELKP